jgi:hypothetical protein
MGKLFYFWPVAAEEKRKLAEADFLCYLRPLEKSCRNMIADRVLYAWFVLEMPSESLTASWYHVRML